MHLDDDPPPEPAPPEVPPRAHSLLATIAKKLSSHTLSHTLKAQEAVDVKHEEFIPQNQHGKCLTLHTLLYTYTIQQDMLIDTHVSEEESEFIKTRYFVRGWCREPINSY